MEKKTKIPVVERKLLFPFIMVTFLFALWGIANDLTNPMVSAFKKVMPELSNLQASLVQFAFYFGYFFMALPAALFIRKYSYKSGIILGLGLYALGAFLFIPAASYEEFNYFLISLWILTCGLAFLETTSNPLILSMGHENTATQRLNLAQAFNPMGALTGLIVAQIFVIEALRSDDYTEAAYSALSSEELAVIRENDLGIISIPYIGLGILVSIIIAIFLVTKIPNNTRSKEEISLKDSFEKLWSDKNYKQGVLAQVFYVGAQIMCWTYIYQYVDNLNSSRGVDEQLTATWFSITATCLFLAGRWSGTFLMRKYAPSKILMWFGIAGAICSAGSIFIVGMGGLISLVCVSIFMSVMFPTIYGIALKNVGDVAKIGSSGLVMAIVGGALLPIVQGGILDIGGDGLADIKFLGYIPEVNVSFILSLICLSAVAYYGYKANKRGL